MRAERGVRGPEPQLLELVVLRCPLPLEYPFRVLADKPRLDQQTEAAPPEIQVIVVGPYLLNLNYLQRMQLNPD